jgi:hypothetical protein
MMILVGSISVIHGGDLFMEIPFPVPFRHFRKVIRIPFLYPDGTVITVGVKICIRGLDKGTCEDIPFGVTPKGNKAGTIEIAG